MYLYGKLPIKLLDQAANRNTNFMFMKNGRLLFLLSMVSEVTVQKNSEQVLTYVEKLTVQKRAMGSWTVIFDHKVKYLSSVSLFFLIKTM